MKHLLTKALFHETPSRLISSETHNRLGRGDLRRSRASGFGRPSGPFFGKPLRGGVVIQWALISWWELLGNFCCEIHNLSMFMGCAVVVEVKEEDIVGGDVGLRLDVH
ncbi:monogalactosyl diacylglycerol synthase 1 [Striga asiatica]|uniref:Monogalactosyl diacylglycerol synthase 1 n=1 Tax=Striga asiatica TaxID=4170 RepID=A0A5A7R4J6_STRAF|nr:monogalactosyl diacylglycerol synthase 1 [Striga asiatica]